MDKVSLTFKKIIISSRFVVRSRLFVLQVI